MAVMDRARKQIPAQGDYLDKDDLVRRQDEPFGIASCVYDEKGHSFGPRWVLSVTPWFDDQEGPAGLITFTANPTRNPMFEDLQVQIEENNNEPIGPVVLIKEKSQKGYRFFTLADWSESVAVQNGSGNGSAAPEPTARPRPARPEASASTPAAAPSATVVAPEAIPANGNGETEKRKRGRPRKDQAPSAQTSAPNVNATSPRPSVSAESVAPEIVQVATPAVATVICPDCHQEVTGRVLPDDKGHNFVIHPFCPTLGKGTIVEVV